MSCNNCISTLTCQKLLEQRAIPRVRPWSWKRKVGCLSPHCKPDRLGKDSWQGRRWFLTSWWREAVPKPATPAGLGEWSGTCGWQMGHAEQEPSAEGISNWFAWSFCAFCFPTLCKPSSPSPGHWRRAESFRCSCGCSISHSEVKVTEGEAAALGGGGLAVGEHDLICAASALGTWTS